MVKKIFISIISLALYLVAYQIFSEHFLSFAAYRVSFSAEKSIVISAAIALLASFLLTTLWWQKKPWG